jgi:hypothetical protein
VKFHLPDGADTDLVTHSYCSIARGSLPARPC